MGDYDLASYAQMLVAEERIAAYDAAIRAAVKPGAVVLEIGAATGFMALLACKYGASRVYAIEPSPAIRVAQQAARDNGFADRIVIHHARSTEITLPERCDVVISDLRGASPLYTTHLVDLMDAQNRLLTPDAAWVCQKDTFHAAVAEAPKGRGQIESWWDGSAWGLDLSSALRYAVNSPYRRRCEAKELLSPSEPWGCIDYPHLQSPHVRGRTALTVNRSAPADGLAVWFEASLYGGARFSNAPEKPPTIYGSMFLPWPHAVPLLAGDRVDVSIDAVLSGQSYEWTWATSVWRDGQSQPVTKFRQSTLQGRIIDPEALRRYSADYRPTTTAFAEEELFLLRRIDGQQTQGEIAAALRTQFPDRFPNDATALNRVLRTVGSVNG